MRTTVLGKTSQRTNEAECESSSQLGKSRGKQCSKNLKARPPLSRAAQKELGWLRLRFSSKRAPYVFITGRRQKELDEAVEAIGGTTHRPLTTTASSTERVAQCAAGFPPAAHFAIKPGNPHSKWFPIRSRKRRLAWLQISDSG